MKLVNTYVFLLLTNLIFFVVCFGQSKIPIGIIEFEKSLFYKQHECFLESIEPMRYKGITQCWFYNYTHYSKNSEIPTQFGMRLTESGKRDSPYMIIRWFPIIRLEQVDFYTTNEYLKEIIGEASKDVITFLETFAIEQLQKENRNSNQETSKTLQIKSFSFYCSLTHGSQPRYPQLTLIIESK